MEYVEHKIDSCILTRVPKIETFQWLLMWNMWTTELIIINIVQ